MSISITFAQVFIALCFIQCSFATQTPDSEKIAAPIPCLEAQKKSVYRISCDPCIYLHKLDLPAHVRSIIPCHEHLPECFSCYSPHQCSTGKCWGGKCVYNTPASMEKCFPKKKGECEPCSSVAECSTDKCWGLPGLGLKCVYDNPVSMAKCFPKKGECQPCRSVSECSTDKCWGPPGSGLKCVYNNPTSMAKCFPKKGECAPCTSASHCITDKCWKGKCVYDTPSSMQKCFPVTVHPPTIIDPCNPIYASKKSSRTSYICP